MVFLFRRWVAARQFLPKFAASSSCNEILFDLQGEHLQSSAAWHTCALIYAIFHHQYENVSVIRMHVTHPHATTHHLFKTRIWTNRHHNDYMSGC
jgi:hypothetical protein